MSASDLTAFVYAIRSQVARIWKATQHRSVCLYSTDLDANFCQVCGSRTSLMPMGQPNKHRSRGDIQTFPGIR